MKNEKCNGPNISRNLRLPFDSYSKKILNTVNTYTHIHHLIGYWTYLGNLHFLIKNSLASRLKVTHNYPYLPCCFDKLFNRLPQ